MPVAATTPTSYFPALRDLRMHALAFLSGIMLVQQLPQLPSLAWSWLLIPCVLLALRNRAWFTPLFFIAGIAWVTLCAGLILQDSLPKALEGRDIWVEGYVADLPKDIEHGTRIEFDVSHAFLNGKEVTIPRKIRLSTGIAQHPRIGDEWGMWVRLKRPHGFQNPGGFDYEGYLFRERIRATGYVRANEPPRLISSDPYSYPIGRFRQYLGESIRAALTGNDFAGMITAFANGDQSDVSDAQWNVLRRTGTTHLIAISGMNIGLVSGIVFLIVRWLWALPGYTVLRLPAQKAAALGALGAAFFYSALAGFAIPTQRALIMLLVVLGALLMQRAVRPTNLLAVALLAVLIYDPLAVVSPGFWLSFASVAVILFTAQGRVGEKRWRQWGRVQWAVTIGLLPLLLLLFQQASLSAPLANLLAIPVIETIVIPLTLLGIVCQVALPDVVAASLFQLAAWSIAQLWVALDYLAAFDQLQWLQHTPPAWTLACAGVGVLWLLAPRGWPARWVGAVWLLPMLLVRPPVPLAGEAWFTLLDVGQGLAAVVRTREHTLVFDTGARFSARFDLGRAVVVPYLRASGVRNMDMLIVSHKDNDHIGGAASLLAAYPPQRVLSSVPERLPNARHCIAGESWRWDEVEFTLLNPSDENARGNNSSCVLMIQTAHGKVLLTADIEAKAERALIARWGEQLNADVLVVPHHGSKTSSTDEFIDAVRPRYALIPAGYRSRYRHPHPTVVERYAQRGINMLNSPAHGAITVTLGAVGMRLSSYRHEEKRYWFVE
ncbi:MAG: DNA internalization-related competence protein ComEC/Rec2 [Proteobacteria bacterium]|nr:DNA internalization-related competence protein ComEC/Rec2 [Pseudomonadota bacterium]